jgi:uncharacterized protein YaaR (DUF327 family)
MKTTSEIIGQIEPSGDTLNSTQMAEAMRIYAEQSIKEVLKRHYTHNYNIMQHGGTSKSIADTAIEVIKDLK